MFNLIAIVLIGVTMDYVLFPFLGLPFSWGAYVAGFLLRKLLQASKQESGFSADWIEEFHENNKR